MPMRISEVFGVSEEALAKEGAFNGFIDIDSKFYVDPHLLENSQEPELKGAYTGLRAYFEKVISLLRASKRPGDRLFREAVEHLTFREVPSVSLGYSSDGNSGSGIGLGIARGLASTAKEIVEAGVDDPEIFELVGLLEENVGADRISDMTIRIILPHLLAYSERVARNLKLTTKRVTVKSVTCDLPMGRNSHNTTILIPQDILSHLPVANDWDDIDYVCQHNAELRNRVNELIGDTWKQATRRVTKRQLRDTLLRYPEALRDLITQYRAKPAAAYDFVTDPAGQLVWHEIAKEFAKHFPLGLKKSEYAGPDDVLKLVMQIGKHFADLVEHNGLAAVMWGDDGKLRHERFAQLLFFGIADAYCNANDLDLSREPNAGRGPVDFKVSKGYHSRVTVEVKFTSNDVVRGFKKQLPIYNQAERTSHSVYIVIVTTKSTDSVDDLMTIRREGLAGGMRVPEIIVVDGRVRPSASKAG